MIDGMKVSYFLEESISVVPYLSIRKVSDGSASTTLKLDNWSFSQKAVHSRPRQD
jgi:hypothetical protein